MAWFPSVREGWHLELVGLLAVVGEACLAQNLYSITATRLTYLPRLLPGLPALLQPERPVRLPLSNAMVVGVYSGMLVQTLGYFANIIHPLEDVTPFSFKVYQIRHSRRVIDMESLQPRFKSFSMISPRRISPTSVLTCLSCLLTIGWLVWAILIHDGVAVIALLLVSASASIGGMASSWQAPLMKRGGNVRIPPGDVVVRTREGGFILIKCDEIVARELYFGGSELIYNVAKGPYQILVAVAWTLLIVGVVLIGSCGFHMKIAIGTSYVVLNGLYWFCGLFSRIKFWDLSNYEWTDVTPPDRKEPGGSFTETLWYALAESRSTKWVEKSGAIPSTDQWRNWLAEAEVNIQNGNRHWNARNAISAIYSTAGTLRDEDGVLGKDEYGKGLAPIALDVPRVRNLQVRFLRMNQDVIDVEAVTSLWDPPSKYFESRKGKTIRKDSGLGKGGKAKGVLGKQPKNPEPELGALPAIPSEFLPTESTLNSPTAKSPTQHSPIFLSSGKAPRDGKSLIGENRKDVTEPILGQRQTFDNIVSYGNRASLSETETSSEAGDIPLSAFARNRNEGLASAHADLTSRSSSFDTLPSGHEMDPALERILRPQQYFDNLRNLHQDILQNAVVPNGHFIVLHPNPSDPYELPVNFPAEYRELANDELVYVRDTDIVKLCHELFQEGYVENVNLLYYLAICRNTIFTVMTSLLKLKKAKFCEDMISIIVADGTRKDVAHLIPVTTESIESLGGNFEQTILEAYSSLKQQRVIPEVAFKQLRNKCERTLQAAKLWTDTALGEDVWICTVQMLDFAVASYVGAHLEPIRFSNSNQAVKSFCFPESSAPDNQVYLELRRLACLDSMVNGQPVWIFRKKETLLDTNDISISTTIETLGDIWGPVESHSLSSQSGDIRSYDIGEGSIFPWKLNTKTDPVLVDGERLCHWLGSAESECNCEESSDHPNTENQLCQMHNCNDAGTLDNEAPPFKLSDRLLIGVSPPRLSLEPCRCSRDDIEQKLQDSGAMHQFKTRKGYTYVDSAATGVSAGYSGVGMSHSRTQKSEKLKTWRAAICEDWDKNPEQRGAYIPVLERYTGVCVSLCTFNTLRVRLVTLLGTETMENVLEDFQFISKDCERAYFNAVQSYDYRTLRKLWKAKPEWQESIGKAINSCLKTLSFTGYDEEHEELVSLYRPTPLSQRVNGVLQDNEPSTLKQVHLKAKEHHWTQLLRNTEDSCTMAVIITECLANRGHNGRRYRHKEDYRPSILETALRINKEIEPASTGYLEERRIRRSDDWSESNAKWQNYWDPQYLAPDTKLELGYQGLLKVSGRIYDTGLLVTWHKDKTQAVRKFLFMSPRESKSHNEFSGERIGVVRPLPVHVQSYSTLKH